jgi:hypothetical protein
MLNIKRESGYADKLRSYEVELDGTTIGEIADGESKSFKIGSGAHTLRLKISWASSNKVNFVSTRNGKVNFRCASRMKGARAWLAIIYVLLLPHKYIELERID